jgi:hypothetical protein
VRARLVCGRTCIGIVVAFVALLDWNCTEDKTVLELACPPRNLTLFRVRSEDRCLAWRDFANRICFGPKPLSGSQRINASLRPLGEFVTGAVDFAMITAAQWDGELVADSTAEGRRLRDPQMMRVRRLSSAYQARPPSDVFQVMAVAKPPRFR